VTPCCKNSSEAQAAFGLIGNLAADFVANDGVGRQALSWLRSELAPHYSSMGRPSIDPELAKRSQRRGKPLRSHGSRLVKFNGTGYKIGNDARHQGYGRAADGG